MAKYPTRQRIFDVSGEAGVNLDGVNRQDIIAELEPGDPVALEREPDNPHDPNAIKVLVGSGECIGYISRNEASTLAPIMDGAPPSAHVHVHTIRGGVEEFTNYGVTVCITWAGQKPLAPRALDEEQLDFREDRRESALPAATGCAVLIGIAGGVGALTIGAIAKII